MRVLQDDELSEEEKLKSVAILDAARVVEILTDEDIYNAYIGEQNYTQIGEEFFNAQLRNLVALLESAEGHYQLPDATGYVSSDFTKENGYSPRIVEFDAEYKVGEGVYFIPTRIVDTLVSSKYPDRIESMSGGLLLDFKSDVVRLVVLSDIILASDPDNIQKPVSSVVTEREQVAKAYYELCKLPEIERRSFSGKRQMRDGVNDRPMDSITELYDQVVYTLNTRVRSFYAAQRDVQVNDIEVRLEKFVEEFDEEYKNIYYDVGGGEMQLQFFVGCLEEDGIVYNKLPLLPVGDIHKVASLIYNTLKDGSDKSVTKVVVIPLGSYIPPEFENRPKLPSPRAHVRRIRTGTEVFVLPAASDSSDIRVIKAKIRRGEDLSPEELGLFSDITGEPTVKIMDIVERNRTKIEQRTIINPANERIKDFAAPGLPRKLYTQGSDKAA